MSIVLNTAHSSGSIFHPQTLSYTANASDTRIIHVAASDANPLQVPSPVTYNNVAMNLLGSMVDSSTFLRLYFYYLDNPSNSLGWGSALNFSDGYTANGTAYATAGVSMAGADLAQVPVIGTGFAANPTTTPAVSVVGGGASDIYLAALWCTSATITSNGAPQSVLTQALAINSGISLSLDEILASSPGNFGWTVANSNTVAIGVLIKALATGGGSGKVSGAGVSGSNVSSQGPGGAHVSGAPISQIIIP